MRHPPGKREIFIFVHGYNNNFADSIFRNAQIVYDYKVPSVALHYAWPSAGSPTRSVPPARAFHPSWRKPPSLPR